jgi:PAS domain S-box-containing protein
MMRRKTIGAAAEDPGSKGFVNRFSIGRRLTLCFVGIFLLLFAVNGILLWQFHSAQVRADRRLTGVSVELIAVLNLQSSLQSFNDSLDRVAQSQNAVILRQESGPLRDMILDSVQDARNAIKRLPPEVRPYPTLIPTIEAIESTLPLQLESLNSLAASGDWSALRLRLANEKQPMDAEISMLVKSISRELNDELGQTVTNIGRLQRQMVIVLPLTALGTLLIASLLGLMITRSITTPLGMLMEGSSALSRGEFDHLVPISGDHELARLGRVFNDTAGKLRSVYETLQDSKAKLEEAQRITHVGYWEWDLTTDCLIWSDETYRIFGLRPQERPMNADALRKMVHPEDQDRVFREKEQTVISGTYYDVEHRIVRPSGEVRVLNSTRAVKKDESGRPTHFYGTVQDITDRKRAEQRLRESEAYLAEAQRLSQTGSWAWNPATGDIRYWSEMCFRILGFDPAGPVPRFEEFVQRIHPDDQTVLRERFDKAIRDKADFELDYRVVHPEKGIRDIHVVGHAVLDGSGILDEFVGTVIDVTERKCAEGALQKSQLYLSEGQRLAHMGSWAFHPSGFFEYWSQELFEIYGLDPQKGSPTLEQYLATIHPQDRDFMANTIKRMHAERSGCDVKKRIVRSDGELRYIRCVGIPVVEGEVLKGFLGTAIDITEQELLTQELKRRQAHLTEAQKLTHTGSWAWRLADRKTVHLSEEFYRIYCFDPAAGAPTWEEYFERVHPEDRFKWKGFIEQAIVERADYDQEFRILFPNGKVKWIHTVGHPVLSDTGDLEQFVGSSTDITELKSAEQEREKLRQLEADLAHIDRVSTLGEMAASLAHEIKQPIAAAITSANTCIEWLGHEPPNLDRARAAAARIDKYGNRAAEIIDRIRSLYKKSPPQLELVDVNGIIHEMFTLLKGEADRFSVAMRTDLSAGLPKIMVDRVQMQQVFMNLMLNAIEAMEDSGGELAVKSEMQDSQLQFSVSDTGVGLPVEKMDQIFSAFFTTKPQGSGMGLAISRSIVESHGGQLWAIANSGGGATFHFTLPVQVSESSPLIA